MNAGDTGFSNNKSKNQKALQFKSTKKTIVTEAAPQATLATLFTESYSIKKTIPADAFMCFEIEWVSDMNNAPALKKEYR